MNRSVSVALVVLVVVSIAAIGSPMTAAGTEAVDRSPSNMQSTQLSQPAVDDVVFQQQAPDTEPTLAIANETPDFDRTTFEITVHEDGSATWTFRYEQRFGTGDESVSDDREAFETFADDFDSDENELYDRFVEQALAMTDSGSELTDREMDATGFERATTVEDQFGERGIVEMSFTWHGFAHAEDGRIEVGDVFEDLYLGPDQAIEINAGDDLTFDRVEPAESAQHPRSELEDADSVRWSGEHEFLDGQPWVVLSEDGAANQSSFLSGGNAAWYLAIAAIVALGVTGGILWSRRRQSSDGSTEDRPGSTQTDSPDTMSPPAAATDDHSDAATAGTDPLPDEELLTDEDRVIKLIRENGGRMKQVNIVDETGWSKSKVSMLLSDMADEGTISKLRVGRENIISLEGYEPEATKSPFDE
ncbi:helix-turn-helix transcriptional regulator [Natronorubrum sulfidifaciens]|uniref:Membrane protein n=1 Tax=Natronorubrum sulfidifaciens JCM 14089 TaxID=1230460 RepID=L9WG23_9EURY|nr:hypothetical protein [Natronorubrum sulfidifaciens]ELY48226.1 membrane protein [Natronorubrum sulfidifaciens JCM 14089]